MTIKVESGLCGLSAGTQPAPMLTGGKLAEALQALSNLWDKPKEDVDGLMCTPGMTPPALRLSTTTFSLEAQTPSECGVFVAQGMRGD